MERFTVYEDPRYYAAFPAAVGTGGGRVLVAFRRATDPRALHRAVGDGALSHLDPRAHLAWVEVDDTLTSASAPSTVTIDPDAADHAPSLVALDDGTILVTTAAYKPVAAAVADALEVDHAVYHRSGVDGLGYLMWGCSARRKAPTATEFSAPVYFSDEPLATGLGTASSYRGGSTRGALCQSGTTILAATYGRRELGQVVTKADARDKVFIYASHDQGRTFVFQTVALADSGGDVDFHQPTLFTRADGTITVLAHTAGGLGKLATSESTDGGKTFSPWALCNVRASGIHAVVLHDGRVLVTYGYRHRPFGVRARICAPDLRDLESAPEIALVADAPNGDVGYPWAVETEPGRALVVFYAPSPGGTRRIDAVLLEV